MDKAGADFYMSVQSIKDRLGATAKAIEIPIGAEEKFRGIIDIVSKKAYEYHNDKQEEPVEIPIPSELESEVELKRAELIEAVSDYDDELIFDPQQRKYYQVVATSMDVWMPGYVRTTTLHNQVLSVMNAERRAQNELLMRQYIDESEASMLDLALPNIYGDTCRLSEHLGKIVVLEFSSSQMDSGNAYVLALRELDNKYNRKGVDIYSVSVDVSKLYWEDWVRNLPWTCVRTETTAPLMTYNVGAVPVLFLLDRNGVVQGRYTDFDELEKDLKKLL